jgi:hypothetical protein
MAKKPIPRGGSKIWLVTIPGVTDLYHVYADTLSVTDAGALVFALSDNTVVYAFPPSGYSRVQPGF